MVILCGVEEVGDIVGYFVVCGGEGLMLSNLL